MRPAGRQGDGDSDGALSPAGEPRDRPSSRCADRRCCDFPLARRYEEAYTAALGLTEQAAELAARCPVLLGIRQPSPNQVQLMVIGLAVREGGRRDLPCTCMRHLVRDLLSTPDLLLVTACLQSQMREAWEVLGHRLRDLALRRTSAPEEALELVGDSFLALRENALWNYDGLRPLDPYVAGILRNTRRSLARTFQAGLGSAALEGLADPTPEPHALIHARLLLRRAHKWLDELGPPDSHIFQERLVSGRTFAAIAREHSLAGGRQEAHRRFWRTLRDLRSHLGGGGRADRT